MEFFNKGLVDQFKSDTALSDKFFYHLSDLFTLFRLTSNPKKAVNTTNNRFCL